MAESAPWIRACRERTGLSQAAAALRAGLSQPTLSRIESGERAAKRDEVMALAWVLGTSPAELTGQSVVAERVVCMARATSGADMRALGSELLHYLELDAHLETQAIDGPT